MTAQASRLTRVFATLDSVLVAVSGGVDSMTLAHVVDRHFGTKARMVHAISPAVPPQATVRVREHAARRGWALSLMDAGEFADPRYRVNPVDRCYFCKSNLYGRLADRFGGLILSGTNTDDLGDYRPGLRAASEHGVRHPFVEAGFSKADIRALAHELGLVDLADLPAAPCLASRVETGIAIKAADLALIDKVENCVRSALGAVDVRCRLTARGVRLELGGEALEQLLLPIRGAIRATVAEIIAGSGRPFLGFAPYRRGSAFLRDRSRV